MIIAACFFLSGLAALIYQTAWMRLFATAFGTSDLAVATVLAAYMAGLAMGAWAGGRLAQRLKRPVLAYGLLEAGVGLGALLVPGLLAVASTLYVVMVGDRPAPPDAIDAGQSIYYVVATFLILGFPTACMGATLPVLLRDSIRVREEIGPKTGLLYSINTIGAVFGTLGAAYWLLPAIGLRNTVIVGAAVNFAVFLLAVVLVRRAKAGGRQPLSAATDGSRHELFSPGSMPILPIIAASGFVSFVYEVLWTRLLGHILGSSIYAFSIMLAAFLTGIAVGAMVAGRIATTRSRALIAFVVVQAAIAIASASVYQWLSTTVLTASQAHEQTLVAIVVMLPATLFIGMTFPLAVRIRALDERGASAASAQVYACNTLGAIFGALACAFFIVPMFGFEGAIRVGVTINLGLAFATLFLVPTKHAVRFSTAAILVLVGLLYQPGRPDAVTHRAIFEIQSNRGPQVAAAKELYYAVGRSSTVLMLEEFNQLLLRTNGLPEAGILRRGAAPLVHNQRWLGLLPSLARADAESMLVVGLGGGVALEAILPGLQDIDVVELEEKVVEANRTISKLRAIDPLSDPRLNIVVNDARNALRLTSKRYDIIISQPSHPWTAGASHLFSADFIKLAKSRLTDGGVFLQWMSADFVDAGLLADLTKTLTQSFNYVRVYRPDGYDLQFLASDAPILPEAVSVSSQSPLRSNPELYSLNGISGPLDLYAALLLDDSGSRRVAFGGTVITDDRNRMATGSFAQGEGLTPLELTQFIGDNDAILASSGELARRSNIDKYYVARRLVHLGMFERAKQFARSIDDRVAVNVVEANVLRAQGRYASARDAAWAAFETDPDSQVAIYALIEEDFQAAALGVASKRMKDAVGKAGPELSTLLQAWNLGANGDWESVARADKVLAKVAVSAPWYPVAMQLRGEWRVRSSDVRAVRDARKLADKALVLRISEGLYALRAAASARLGDTPALLESFRSSATFILKRLIWSERGAELGSEEKLAIVSRLDAMIAALQRVPKGDDQARVELLAASLVELRDTTQRR